MTIPLNLNDFEALAKPKLQEMVYGYYVSGSDEQVTLSDNRQAYNSIKLRPRMLAGVGQRDTSTRVLGQQLSSPVMIAPMGFMQLAHPDGELAMARAAASRQVPMILSTAANHTIEQVAGASDGLKWFQLYVYKDRAVTQRLVERAEQAGYQALVLTVDVPVLGRREADIRTGFHLPDGLTMANLMGDEMADIRHVVGDSGLNAYLKGLWDANLDWSIIAWLKSITSMPILVKGILRGDDALLALDHGADGIIVSNHGGRQLDTAPATIMVLQEIVDAVAGRADILLDGGIRRGTDIIKALAIGAKAVLIGRPMMWALAYEGQAGVEYALDLILAELDNAMALCGCPSIVEITPDLLWKP